MSALRRLDLLEGKRLSELRRDDVSVFVKCSCGRSIRRCTFVLGGSHADLSFEVIERKYLDWLCLHGYLLIEQGLDSILQ